MSPNVDKAIKIQKTWDGKFERMEEKNEKFQHMSNSGTRRRE